MKPGWNALALLALAAPATADDGSGAASPGAERCARGLAYAEQKDLPRAALYLDGCDDVPLDDELAAKVRRTRAAVAHALAASKLSALTIVTTPEGLVAQTDALPGERFTTPATIWALAGDYRVDVARDAATLDAGKGISTTTTLDAFSRRTVIIDLPPPPAAAKAGKVDFTEDTPEQTAHTGPPPPVKHDTLIPERYRQTSNPRGPLLDDPFEIRTHDAPWRLGARLGGGVFVRGGADAGIAVTVAVTAARPVTRGLAFSARASWAHRDDLDALALDIGAGVRLAVTRRFVLSATAALRGEVRVQDELAMQPVARVGLGAGAGLDVALRSLPLTIGARVEPSFTELVPGARNHNVLVELGYDWR